MNGGRAVSRTGPHEQLLAQLSYLIDEVSAVKQVLAAFPYEILAARPIDGEPSVLDLFATLLQRERSVRLPNVKRLLSAGDDHLVSQEAAWVIQDRPDGEDPLAVLDSLISARGLLVQAVAACDARAETHSATLAGQRITLDDYLYEIIQEDLAILRVAAQRVYESRPVGSPGFTAR